MEGASKLPKAKSLHAALRRVSRTLRQILGLAFDPRLSRTYWPEEVRKSRPRIWGELIWWLIRTGEANNFYYAYGLDRKSTRRSDVMSFRKFQHVRNRVNLRVGRAPYNYVCVLRDKLLFSQFASSLGIPTPTTLAWLDNQHVSWLDRNGAAPLETLVEPGRPDLDGFCKTLDGMQGEGAFPLRIEQGRLIVAAETISLEELRQRLTKRFLLQQRIRQHPAMDALNPSSVNTMRLVSFCVDYKAAVLFGALRVGTAHSHVDNWAAGGLVVGIDLERGELRDEGFFKPGHGGRTEVHPDSHTRFEGFEIPYFSEAMAMVVRLHEQLPHIHSIGWDVGISTEGPIIIEGNDDWDGVIQMVLERGFKQRFLGLLGGTSVKPLRLGS